MKRYAVFTIVSGNLPGDVEIIKADFMSCENSYLIFYIDEEVTAIFCPGHWSAVREIHE